MDPHGDPKDEGVDPTKNILRTGKTPSGMPWTTYSTPFGEQTHTQEEEEKTGKDIERFFAPRTSTIYSHPKLGNVTFTNEEQDAIYREAASTLPKKLHDLKPTWYRRSLDGPQIFVWSTKVLDGTYLHGFYDEELNDELAYEMAPRLHETMTREALKKLNLPAGSDGGLGPWRKVYD